MSESTEKIAALNETIRALRKADRWRLRKRNRTAIKTIKATQERIANAALQAELDRRGRDIDDRN